MPSGDTPPGARSVVSVAHCYWSDEAQLEPGQGRLARYAWADAYAGLRERLDELGRRIGGAYRVLVDANQHVDREAAARSGVGFYGKNTMMITRRHGSWVVLGTLVTDRELEATPPLDADCGACRLCIDACPTGALDDPGTLDATKCLSYWTQAPESIPAGYRAALGAQVYGCDICQDVCPWNRGVEKRRARRACEPRRARRPRGVARARRPRARRELRPPLRAAQRPALAAPECARGARQQRRAEHREVLMRFAEGDDAMLAEHARWALERVMSRRSLESWIGIVRLLAIPFAILQVALTANYPRGDEQTAWILTASWPSARSCSSRRCASPTRRDSSWQRRRSISASSRPSRCSSHSSRARRRASSSSSRSSLGAARFGMPGGFAVALAAIPVSAWFEIRRSRLLPPALPFRLRHLPGRRRAADGAARRLALRPPHRAERGRGAAGGRGGAPAGRARPPRGPARSGDPLRRVLSSSSLDLDEAFGAFIRELRGLVPFDRMAIVLAEGDVSHVIATAGASADAIEPPGSESSLENNLVAEIVARGQTVYRADMSQRSTPRKSGSSTSAFTRASPHRSSPAPARSA